MVNMVRGNSNKLLVYLIILILLPSLPIHSIITKSQSLNQSNIPASTKQTSTSTKVNKKEYSISKKYQYDESLGAMNDIVIQDDLAYVAVRWGGLVIFNISNLAEPKIIGTYIEPVETISDTDLTSGIFVRDNIAFLADGLNGLLILNVTNPQLPLKIGQYNEDSYWRACFRVYVEDNIAYITTRIYLLILDISDLTSPIKISEIDHFGYNKDIKVKRGIIFLASSSSIKIINATNPTFLEEITILTDTRAFTLQEDILFTTAGQNNFVTYNITKSSFLSKLFNYTVSISGLVNYICTNVNYTFIGSTDEIVALDISNFTYPQNTVKITNLNRFYETNDTIKIKRKLAIMDDLDKNEILFFTDYQQGLFIYNISKPSESTLVTHFDCGKRAESVTVSGDYIYVMSHVQWPYYPSQLDILTINDGSLHLVGRHNSNDSVTDIIVLDEIVLLAGFLGIEVVDISNPENPTRLYNYPIGALSMLIDQKHSILYLCSGVDGVYIINASDFNNLTLINHIADIDGYDFNAVDVVINDDILFIADGQEYGGFGIVNVSDPFNLITVGYYPVTNNHVLSITVQEELLYLSTQSPQLMIFDVSDLNIPILLSNFIGNFRGSDILLLHDGVMFMAHWIDGLTLLDVQDSLNPIEIMSVRDSLTGICVDLFLNKSNIFLADAWDGLEVWELVITPLFPMWKTTVILLSSIVVTFIATYMTIIILKRRKKT
ncbi:MAG: hypothetical protein FK733_09850 [Asgard group archaeon]|nr:hypothetical protein [Asgard group archaeon]